MEKSQYADFNEDKTNCLQEFVHKNIQNVHRLEGHIPGDAFFTGQLQYQ